MKKFIVTVLTMVLSFSLLAPITVKADTDWVGDYQGTLKYEKDDYVKRNNTEKGLWSKVNYQGYSVTVSKYDENPAYTIKDGNKYFGHIITTKSKFNDVIDYYDLKSVSDKEIQNVINSVDDKFFESNKLYFGAISVSSGSTSYEIKNVKVSKLGHVKLTVKEKTPKGITTDDMGTACFMAAVSKSDVTGAYKNSMKVYRIKVKKSK